jgi:hypothetical protein
MSTGLDLRQLQPPFYGETMTRDRFLHILHFANSSDRPDRDEEYDQL